MSWRVKRGFSARSAMRGTRTICLRTLRRRRSSRQHQRTELCRDLASATESRPQDHTGCNVAPPNCLGAALTPQISRADGDLATDNQMGHSSIKVTFDTYGHLFPGRGKEASDRYEKSMQDARQRPEADVSKTLAIEGERKGGKNATN